MKIAVISDTHVRKHMDKIEKLITKSLKDVDLVIHAGDYTSNKVIPYIEKHHRFIGVYGNNDKDETRSKVKEKQIITLDKYKIGIYHGHGSKKNAIDNVYEIFKNDSLDVIIFGHSHKPFVTTKNKTLIINPGSPTSKRKEKYYSYIILELVPEGIDVNIKFYS
ncbi:MULTISPECIES: metallophosphoesterase family protein [unclassified Clostridium]|uniref:metallophosphoesterase family protein n=1 Tax=unclassified Clostridium TaxID=2614128 RepID=UPI0025C2F44F|nr:MULTISPECIES: metallophosphoesterase [unclassified Clostridium]